MAFFSPKSAEEYVQKMNDPKGQHLSPHTSIGMSHPQSPVIFPNPSPFQLPDKTKGQKEKKKKKKTHQQEDTRGASMWTRWTKHADILQGRQKKCPLEQWR